MHKVERNNRHFSRNGEICIVEWSYQDSQYCHAAESSYFKLIYHLCSWQILFPLERPRIFLFMSFFLFVYFYFFYALLYEGEQQKVIKESMLIKKKKKKERAL